MLLSDALWRRRFGGGAAAIGRAITLDNQPYTIVGVLPPRFQLLQPADILLPMGPWAATLPDDRGWHPGIFPLARLKAGVDLQQAQAEMDVISERLAKQYPEFNHGVAADVKPLHDFAVQNVRQSLLVLVAAVGFVLLIACSNVANLLLARAVGRQKEMAIRTAIGASRGRIAMQMLVESVVLAARGGLAGLLLATWAVPLLAALAGANAPARRRDRHRSDRAGVHDRASRSRPASSSASRPRCRRRASTSRPRSTKAAAAPPPEPATIACARCWSSPRWRWRRCCWSARGC